MLSLEDFEIELGKCRLEGCEVFEIGKTELGRTIYAVHKGNFDGGQVFVQASIHAREWVTTKLVLRLIQGYKEAGGVWVVPMVNVDGVMLCQYGVMTVYNETKQSFLLGVNGGSSDFSQWKANANAVDLNVNFNANWATGAKNVFYPSPSDFVGDFPCSEKETRALVDITNRINPKVTLSYHAKGEVIFEGFGCLNPYIATAKKIAASTGYALENSYDSAGGYKDWYVATTARLGLTFEVGQNSVPYDKLENYLLQMQQQNAQVFAIASELATTI